MKKPVCMFTVADQNNLKYYEMIKNSLRKFHSEEELPLKLVTEQELETHLKSDPNFFYRQKPTIAKELIKEYELAIGADCDQLIFGKLDHILYDESYDVGTVLNINRVDPPQYGLVSIQGVAPNEYYNAGLVAMRNRDFVQEWLNLCNSKYFERLQYREQDALNIMAHFGRFNVKCFDSNQANPTYNGLVAKGETIHAQLKDGQVIIPKGEDNYPDRDTVLKVLHQAGGQEKKMNWRTWFSEDMQEYVEWLISDTNEPYGQTEVKNTL